MIFLIKRASLWNDERPHELAQPVQIHWYDVRNVADPSELGSKFDGPTWYTNPDFRNHTKRPGFIIRESVATRPAWVIEIDTMEELTDFIAANGKVIVDRYAGLPYQPIAKLDTGQIIKNVITIYDDWIE